MLISDETVIVIKNNPASCWGGIWGTAEERRLKGAILVFFKNFGFFILFFTNDFFFCLQEDNEGNQTVGSALGSDAAAASEPHGTFVRRNRSRTKVPNWTSHSTNYLRKLTTWVNFKKIKFMFNNFYFLSFIFYVRV